MRLTWIFLIAGLLSAATANYSYDASGRLAKIDYGSGGSITYMYDNAGNLLSRTVAPAGQAAAPATPPATTPKDAKDRSVKPGAVERRPEPIGGKDREK